MKLLILSVLVIGSTFPATAEIPGCTSDVRSGVCNKVCSLGKLDGCTLQQFKALTTIEATDCIGRAFHRVLDEETDNKRQLQERLNAECQSRLDEEIATWKAAQQKKPKK